MPDISEKSLLSVLKGQVPKRRPMWFMRQAGRYLPEYRKVRAEAGSFLDLCYNSKLAAEVTLQPLRRYDIDAAIIFADILVVPHAMGNGLSFQEGEGPLLQKVEGEADMKRLRSLAGSAEVEAVCESIRLVRAGLPPHVAMIGFCGAPWTVASYMVEGRGSDRQQALTMAHQRPRWFAELIDLLVEQSIIYLRAQADAGAEALQIFDSWAGDLSGPLFDELSIEPMRRIAAGLKSSHPAVPVIAFARGAGARHVRVARDAGCAAIGIEQECDIDQLLPLLPTGVAVQGNLDPVCLLAGNETISREATRVAMSVPMHRHVFNLGHGIKQQTPAEALEAVIKAVRKVDGA